MLEYKTVKYHIPQQGIYLYARTNEGKTEMIVLNSTDQEQTLPSEHYNALTNGRKTGTEIASGKQVDFTRNLVLPARQSLVIEILRVSLQKETEWTEYLEKAVPDCRRAGEQPFCLLHLLVVSS